MILGCRKLTLKTSISLLADLGFDLADRGALHKAVILGKEVHVVEETQLFQDYEPVQTLLLSSKKVMWSGAGPGACLLHGEDWLGWCLKVWQPLA